MDDYSMKKLLDEIFQDALVKSFKNDMRKFTSQPSYEQLEYECETTVTDEDMLQIQIDQALDSGNKELFLELTSRLNKSNSLEGAS